MARSRRTAPRKRRRTTTAKRRTTAAAAPKTTTPAAPAAPTDTRLTNAALRSHVRRSKKPVFNLLGAFHRLEHAGEDRMDAIRRSMR